jgi:chorismate synthase
MREWKERPAILSGVRHGETIGSPIAVFIPNGERERWMRIMSQRREDYTDRGAISRPRPGHADLAGALKYGIKDVRNVVERASARETAARVALGACTKAFLRAFRIEIGSHVVSIGSVEGKGWFDGIREDFRSGEKRLREADSDPVRFLDGDMSRKVCAEIDAARKEGETLGGIFEVIAMGAPAGLGNYVHWDRRLDGRLAGAIMSIPGVKGVEIGKAFENALLRGSSVHDVISLSDSGDRRGVGSLRRETNRAGGVEGGVSNGEEIVIRAAMKPLPTLKNPLTSVDLKTMELAVAEVERGDVCAVPAAGIVGESMVAMVLADLLLEKFGGDSVDDIGSNLEAYQKRIHRIFSGGKGESG